MTPLAGWSACKKITVKTTYLDAAQTNFIFVYKPTAETDIGGRCLASGFDIRFTQSDGTTLLNYERVSFAVAGGAATGIFWIQSNLATAPATDVYIHYGNAAAPDVSNAAATWTAYTRVWHLSEAYSTAAGNYKDALGVGNLTLTDADADSAQGTGIVGNCVDLNGDADYLTDADHADHDPGGAMTIEVWRDHDTISAGITAGVLHGDTGWGGSWYLASNAVHGADQHFRGRIITASGAVDVYGNTELPLSNSGWYYAVLTFDKTLSSNRINVYCQGVVDCQGNGYAEDVATSANGIIIGTSDWGALDGLIDEVRYSKDAKSASWIKFVYYNITEADNCLTIGAEELPAVIPSGLGQFYGIDLQNKI